MYQYDTVERCNPVSSNSPENTGEFVLLGTMGLSNAEVCWFVSRGWSMGKGSGMYV